MDDREVVAAQLERPLRSAADVVVRCALGLPVVTRVPPILDDGTPFPTRYWLCCPLAVRRVSRIESAGGVMAMDRRARAVPGFGERLAAAHTRYATERDAAVLEGSERVPTGGVAGSARGVKCLHAHYADHAFGNENPVGEMVAPWVEPLDCTLPCVVGEGGRAVRNDRWREPR